ncbi:MAG: tetratricopeptide repeat protein [Thermodesulfobacteriota bacterium]
MNAHSRSRLAWILLGPALFALALATPGWCGAYSFDQRQDRERLVFEFDAPLPRYSSARTGATEILLTLPKGLALDGRAAPGTDLGRARLVAGVSAVDGGVRISLRDPGFGFVVHALPDSRKLVVDIFRDPLGARWKPDGAPAPAAQPPAPKPETKAPAAPAAKAEAKAPAAPAKGQARGAAAAPAGKAPAPEPAPQPAPEAAQVAAPEPSPAAPRPFYAVPYVFRGKVRSVGPDQAQPVSPQEAQPAPPAAAAAPPAAPAPVAPPAAPPAPVAPPAAGKGQVRGGIVKGEPSPAAPPVPAAPPSAPEEARVQAPAPAAPVRPEPFGRDRLVENLMAGGPGSEFRGAVLSPPPAAQVEAAMAAKEPPLPQPEPEAPARPAEQAEAPSAPAEPAANMTEVAEAPAADNATMSFEESLLTAQSAISMGNYQAGLDEVEALLRSPKVPKTLREEALYTRADVLYAMNREDLAGKFDLINGAYEAAMNYNLKSERLPAALLRLSVLNLNVGNLPEATAYTKLLRTKHPNDSNVPLSYYYWGDYYFKKGDYQNAADQFQYLVQVYPDSKFVRESSVSLAQSLRKLGYDKQAAQIVDFIEKRWPRFYVEYPPILRLSGDVAFANKDWKKAKDDYWVYYNLDPKGEDADVVLARIGDIYVESKTFRAAKEIYEKAADTFPEREGGLIARMRLAEEGIYDQPSVEDMFTVFDRPFNKRPVEIYQEIIAKHPDSPLAPLAQLKMAIWYMWDNKNLDALKTIGEFDAKFPDSALKERAHRAGLKAFERAAATFMREQGYGPVVSLYDEYPFIRKGVEDLDAQTRLSLGLSLWKAGRADLALDMVRPFLGKEQVPQFSELAMGLAVGVFVDNQNWEKVVELASVATSWEMAPEYKRELTYALALAHENLHQPDQARPLWMELGHDPGLDRRQKAYATYFLAQDAVSRDDLKTAYEFAQDAYTLLLESGEDPGKIRDSLAILVDVTERSARPQEALNWARQFGEYVTKGDPGWPAHRYRLAGLYRQNGDEKAWRETLTDLAKAAPASLYGRMAASELQTSSLEQAAREYSPSPNFQ